MNAPLKSKTVAQGLLIAANQQLETVFSRSPEPCVALLISRNYHLLMQEQTNLTARLNWMQNAKYWWQKYLKLSTGKQYNFMFDIDHDRLLFKRVDMPVFRR
jgi:hypothetical protein